MEKRLELQAILEDFCDHVYFQPPVNVRLQYPCIVYKRDDARTDHADNAPYRFMQRYAVTIIDKDPDSPLPGRVAALPSAQFNRYYPADNLNHDVFTLFF